MKVERFLNGGFIIKKLNVEEVANRIENNKKILLLEALPEKHFKKGTFRRAVINSQIRLSKSSKFLEIP